MVVGRARAYYQHIKKASGAGQVAGRGMILGLDLARSAGPVVFEATIRHSHYDDIFKRERGESVLVVVIMEGCGTLRGWIAGG